MIQLIKTGKLACRCALADNVRDSKRICYLLLPKPMECTETLTRWSSEHECCMVELSGMDWNKDLTPWPSKGFGGKAETFLQTLQCKVLPTVEVSLLGGKATKRLLMGISLSGLFAVWAWIRSTDFDHIVSLSGSFWYEGFAEWIEAERLSHKDGCAYFTISSSECRNKKGRFGTVGERTNRVVDAIKRASIHVVGYEITHGSHFSPIAPRIDLALKKIEQPFELEQ